MPEWLGHVIEILALLALGWQQRQQHSAVRRETQAASADVGKLRELIKSSLRPPAMLGFDCEHDQNVWDFAQYRWCADCGALKPPANHDWFKPGTDLTPRSLPPRKGSG
jgi:hypothetical protein